MGVTIGVLVLLMFTIQGLGLFERLAERWGSGSVTLDAAQSNVVVSASPEVTNMSPKGEIVAAIAAALALSENESQIRHGVQSPQISASDDAWTQAGRRHLMDQRRRPSR